METEMWLCDKCGRPIKQAKDGWLYWMRNLNDFMISDFKIIHHPTCQHPEPQIQKSMLSTPGDPLVEFQGENGLIRLLELIPKVKKENQNEIIDIIQRLHVPGYETARLHFEQAENDGFIVPHTQGVYYLTIEKLQEINKEYAYDSDLVN